MRSYAWLCSLLFVAASALADTDPTDVEEIVVKGRSDSLIGAGDAASQGTVGAEQLEMRTLSRPGEVLETVPGLIVTQHSGAGKANQFFLRGFNLDHGTDFATWVDGVPVNLPSHGHGQGYTDLNFLIPELVELAQNGLESRARAEEEHGWPARWRCRRANARPTSPIYTWA